MSGVIVFLSLLSSPVHAQATAEGGSVDPGVAAPNGGVPSAQAKLDAAREEDKNGHSIQAMRITLEALELAAALHDARTESAARAAFELYRSHTAKVAFALPSYPKDIDIAFVTGA